MRDWWFQFPLKKSIIRKFIKSKFIHLFSTSFQLKQLKKGWHLISSASPFPEPNLFEGFLWSSYAKPLNLIKHLIIKETDLSKEPASDETYDGIFNGALSMFINNSSLINKFNKYYVYWKKLVIGVIRWNPNKHFIHHNP